MIKFFKSQILQLRKDWDQFWFGDICLLQLALFRIVLCGTLFVMYLSRQFDAAAYFGEASFIPREMTLELFQEFYRMRIPWHFWPDSQAVWIHGFFVVSLLLLTLGIGGRAFMLLTWVLHMGFLYRNYAIAFGADLIGGGFLLYLAGTQSCARLSLLNWLKLKMPMPKQDLLTPFFYRMIQIQLCVIYAFTGFEKLKGGTWWDGTALWTIFANTQLSAWNFEWTRQFPAVIALLTFSTILFEIYFPVLVWVKRARPFLLLAGLAFHLGIAFTLALPTFSAVMLAPYILFLSKELFQQESLSKFSFQNLFRRS